MKEKIFFYKIVTGDGFIRNQEAKEHCKLWMHSYSSNKPKKFKQTFSIMGLKRSSLVEIHGTWHNHHCSLVQHGSSTSTKGNSEQAKRNVFIRHTLQLQQRDSCNVFDGKCSITQRTAQTWLLLIFISFLT